MKNIKILFTTVLIAMNMVILSCSDNSHSSEPTYCMVTFMNLGTSFKTEVIESGKKVAEPTSPTRNGYMFSGWYDNNSKFDFSKPITSDIILTAKWEPSLEVTYTITFNSDGGNKIASQTVKSGEKATEPTQPIKDGYDFLGWYDDDTVFNFDSPITKNTVLTAKWETIKFPNYLNVEEYKSYKGDQFVTNYTIKGYIEEHFPVDGVISIPEGITGIDSRAFENCTELTSIHIPASVTYIGRYAFTGCTNLKSATFENNFWYYKTSQYIAAKSLTWNPNSATNAAYLTNTYSKFDLSTDKKM